MGNAAGQAGYGAAVLLTLLSLSAADHPVVGGAPPTTAEFRWRTVSEPGDDRDDGAFHVGPVAIAPADAWVPVPVTGKWMTVALGSRKAWAKPVPGHRYNSDLVPCSGYTLSDAADPAAVDGRLRVAVTGRAPAFLEDGMNEPAPIPAAGFTPWIDSWTSGNCPGAPHTYAVRVNAAGLCSIRIHFLAHEDISLQCDESTGIMRVIE